MAADDGKVCRITVLASGSGSNFQALIDGLEDGRITDCKIVKLFVNRAKAVAIQRAQKAAIPHEYFNLVSNGFCAKGETDASKVKEGRARYDAALAEKILQDKPDLIVLAGWMHVFSEPFLTPLAAAGVKVINLHPAKPGCYDGANAIGRAYEDFQAGKLENNRTGAMIHYVIAQVDRGEPILVQEVEVLPSDKLEDLEERMHQVEHQLIVRATAQVSREILAKKE
ncbi:phosphoribosylglycinamide formyltransferase [Colletotrichum karsti]|uniref:Phosphoribosylglycinamide formyltransferase n=1 Tax=Colletotrichum karsti TaxID=1095194 RepID=A0A9P6I166_9PEZI|nr:phosphoribosylglycinamide formyltransferase [Colletotrichum karsti]KAF9869995.1 phosphoribosylglycinamide formyltransferase [Colletotrichum karsti]